jgi:hypothetical protein
VEQSALEAHDVLHDVALHSYAPHDVPVLVRQVPAPSQVLAGVQFEPLHDSLTQTVPTTHLRQAPTPSHWPSRPQPETAACAHSLSGSVPPVTGRQRPLAWPVLALEQAAQLPAHAVSQQTASAQKPLAQSVAVAQTAPFAAPIGESVPPSAGPSFPASVPPPPAAPAPAAPPVPPAPPASLAPAAPPVPAAPVVPATPPVPAAPVVPAAPAAPVVPAAPAAPVVPAAPLTPPWPVAPLLPPPPLAPALDPA